MKMCSKEVYFIAPKGEREYYYWKHIDLFPNGTYVFVKKMPYFMFFDPETIKNGVAKWYKVNDKS